MQFHCTGINGVGLVAICVKRVLSNEEGASDEPIMTNVESEYPSKSGVDGDVVELPVLGFFVTESGEMKAAVVNCLGVMVPVDQIVGFSQVAYQDEAGVVDEDDWGDADIDDEG